MSESLANTLTRYTNALAGESPFSTVIDGLIILRSNHAKPPSHLIFKPALCIVVQGAKWTTLGGKRFDYRAGQALVVSIERPAFGRVVEASPSKPFLGIVIEFDLTIMQEVMERLDTPPLPNSDMCGGVLVTNFNGSMADCVQRLVHLLDTPDAIPMLYPMIMREMCYWLLSGPHGGEVAKIALASSHAKRVITAIHTLRERFAEPVCIENACPDRADELLGIPPSVQNANVDDAAAISKAAAVARGPTPDGRGHGECRDGLVSSWLREPFPIQPRIFPHVRRPTATRHGSVEGACSLREWETIFS